MQIIHEEPELTIPFEICTNPQRHRRDPESEPLDTFMDRLWWLAVGYVSAILIIAVAWG